MSRIAPDIVLVTNSPGELSSWVRAAAESLKRKKPDARIIVALVPCPFAAGNEEYVAHRYDAVDLVIPPAGFFRFLLRGARPDEYIPAKSGIVVFLGGDYWHAVLMAWKLRYPAVAYAAHHGKSWQASFRYVFCQNEKVRDRLIQKGIPEEKLKIVGNLMIEGIRPTISKEDGYKKWGLAPDRLITGILPGSRLYSLQESLPVFLKVAEEIKSELPDVQFLLGMSPFRTLDEVSNTVSKPESPIPGSGGKVIRDEWGFKILTENGADVRIIGENQHDMMSLCDVVMTIPGTNTAECAYLGKPMVVAVSWKARIPGGGLGFFINSLPVCGIRRAVMQATFRKLKYVALPNIIAGRRIVPEVRIENDASEITEVVLKLLRDKKERDEMSRQLKSVMGEVGAADRISDFIIDVLHEQEALIG